jgi:hypothetical protein
MIHGLVVMNPDHFTVKGNDPAGLKKGLLLKKKANEGSRAEQGKRNYPGLMCGPVLKDEPVPIPRPIRENTDTGREIPANTRYII